MGSTLTLHRVGVLRDATHKYARASYEHCYVRFSSTEEFVAQCMLAKMEGMRISGMWKRKAGAPWEWEKLE